MLQSATRPFVRALVLFLVLWSIADCATYGACPDDPLAPLAGTETNLSACQVRHTATDGVLHTHHCFCRAQWAGTTDPALPVAPALSSPLAADRAPAWPETAARRLDHPPQLAVA